ncbi:MAG TPA: condensation domain-containing protein, partial [Thermoanaerobaculia bacterium]|nr:condensation domain-containing protein [Thermoanaerobaculia bacterium]
MSASPATGVLAGLSREEKARLFEQLRARGTGAAAPAGIPRLAERPEPLPLSFAQGRLWVIDRLAPGNPTYHIPTALSVRGSLDPAAMAAALTGVATRHEALRTRFVEAEAGLGQRVEPPAQVPLPMLDLARLSAAAKARELERAFLAESTRPFVLATGPVFRAALARLAPSEHALLLNLHHIVSDGWSSSILVRETAALYEAAVERRPCALRPLPIQYADFAVWQRRFLSGAELDRQLGFWRERLAGAPR